MPGEKAVVADAAGEAGRSAADVHERRHAATVREQGPGAPSQLGARRLPETGAPGARKRSAAGGVLELHDAVQLAVVWGDAATGDGVDDGLPFVCAEPWGCDTRVGDVEDGDGEGFEGRCGGDGEVDDLTQSLDLI